MTNLTEQCNNLFSDSRLNELLEINKSSSDLLDLLSPRENQHSEILEWCFNPREGHDQGDTVLKDFFIAIYNASTEFEPGDRLHGKGLTRDFVRYWTPGRVATSSFGSAVFFREYALPSEGKGKNRIDLLIIDPDQKILVVVENKAGTKLTEGQLTGYLNGICQNLLNKAMFKDFKVAFVALDKNYDPELDDEDCDNGSPDPRWAMLNYEWLTSAAKRAEHAIKRGNNAAALLRSYCQRQSSNIEYDDDRTNDLIHLLARDHSEVLKELKNIRATRSNPELWTKFRDNSPREYLLRIYMQNPRLLDQLINLRPIDTLDAEIRHELGYLEDDKYWLGRVYSYYCTAGADSLPVGPNGKWPLYILVKHTNESMGEEPKFSVGIRLRPQYLPEDEREHIMEKLSSIFPSLSSSRIQEKGKLIKVGEDLKSDDAKNMVVDMERKLKAALKPS